jgi:hypothetical protein
VEHDADTHPAVSPPPPSTVGAEWVQSLDEQPRNSWTWPWPPREQGSGDQKRPPSSRGESPPAPPRHAGLEDLQSGIEQNSAEPSDTVHALSGRLDVMVGVADHTDAAKHPMLQTARLKADDMMSHTITAIVERQGAVKLAVYVAAIGVLVTVIVLSLKLGVHRR